ncbi:MAG: AAA family ATPase [Ramlibacter sp.]
MFEVITETAPAALEANAVTGTAPHPSGMLLERQPLLQQLAHLLARAEMGEGACIFVGGEAGVGKTSLVRQLVADLPQGVGAFWGINDALQTPSPLAALHDMISQLDAAARQRLSATTERIELFSTFLDAVSIRPALLVFEDVHWADEATLDLLRYLARRVRRSRLLVVATHRDDETGPSHPLRVLLGDLATAGVHRMAIPPLTPQGVHALVGPGGMDARALHARTGGNPFFVTEVIAAGADVIPETVRDAVLARVLRCGPQQRAVLALLAIVPGHTERWLVDTVLPDSEDSLCQCAADGLLVIQEHSARYRHEIARQAVEQWLTPSTARGLHARVLAALEVRAPDALANLVHHAVHAGAAQAIVRHAWPAALQAAQAGAHREAASHYAQALASGAIPDEQTRAGWLEAQAYELYLVGEIHASIECRFAAGRIWEARQDLSRHGGNLRWLSRLHWMLGDTVQAARLGMDAVEQLERVPPGTELAMAYSNLAQLRMLAEDTTQASLWGERAIALAQACGATDVLVHALNNVGNARAFEDGDGGLPQLEQSLQLALDHGLEEHAARAYCNLASGAVGQRDYVRATAWLEEGIAYSSDRGLESWSVYLTARRSRAHLDQGRWDAAQDDALEVLGRTGLGAIWRIPAMTVLACLHVRRGDPASAQLLDEVQRITLPTGELQRIWPVTVARAEAAWLAGELDRCREEARVGYALAVERSNPWALGETALWMWRAGALEAAPVHCAEPYALLMRGDWRAAAAAWRALGCPYEEADALAGGDEKAQRDALLTFERLGAQPAARRLRERMRAQGQRKVPRGPRATTQANALGLTSREQEVMDLLERGWSNAQIAGHVHRSVRTVDHHVASILSKLGVASRAGAVQKMRQSGPLRNG